MAKKIILSIVLMLLFSYTLCFATDKTTNMNLGDEITGAIEDTGNGMENITNDLMNGTSVMNNNRVDNYDNISNNGNVSSRNYQTSVNGYNAYRTDTDVVAADNTTMSTTTIMWIILAVAAIIIVAMIWYYAIQSDTNNRR